MEPRTHHLDADELAAWDRARLNVEDLPIVNDEDGDDELENADQAEDADDESP